MRMNDDGDERVDSIMAQQNLVVCNKCGGVNRLPPARYAMEAKCGACGTRLFSVHPEDVAVATFDHQTARSSLPGAVEIWLGIRSIPAMILFGGREVAHTSGAMTAGQIARWVRDRLLAIAD